MTQSILAICLTALVLSTAVFAETPTSQPATQPTTQPTSQPAAVVIDDSADGTTITVGIAQELQFRLEGNATTGYQWSLASTIPEGVLKLVSINYEPIPSNGRMGTGGTYIIVLKAVAAGQATATLAYVRPWEKETPPVKTFTVTVNVTAEPAPTSQPSDK